MHTIHTTAWRRVDTEKVVALLRTLSEEGTYIVGATVTRGTPPVLGTPVTINGNGAILRDVVDMLDREGWL